MARPASSLTARLNALASPADHALREALYHAQEGGVTREEVLGVTTLLLWALIFIVTGKYVLFGSPPARAGAGGYGVEHHACRFETYCEQANHEKLTHGHRAGGDRYHHRGQRL